MTALPCELQKSHDMRREGSSSEPGRHSGGRRQWRPQSRHWPQNFVSVPTRCLCGCPALAEQLGLPPPVTCPVMPAEAAKRKQLRSELEAMLDAPLTANRAQGTGKERPRSGSSRHPLFAAPSGHLVPSARVSSHDR